MKKLLSIMLTVVMLASVFAISASAFVPTRVTTVVPETYPLNETFDNAETAAFASITTKTSTVENGYLKVDAATKYGVTDLNAPDIASFTADKYTVEFTVRKSGDTYIEGDMNYVIGFGICRAKNANDDAFKKFGLVMPFGDLDNGVTRTYKFTVDETAASTMAAFSNVSVQDGDAAPQTLTRSSSWTAGHWQEEKYSNYIGVSTSGFSIRTVHGTSDTHGDLVLYVESVKITVPSSSSSTDYAVNEGVHYTIDFETEDSNFVPYIATKNEEEVLTTIETENNNTYYTLTPNANRTLSSYAMYDSNHAMANLQNTLRPNTTITFDLKCNTKGIPFTIIAGRNDTLDLAPLSVAICGTADSTWYTYKIEVGNFTADTDLSTDTTMTKVYRKVRGAADSTYTELNGVATKYSITDTTVNSYDYILGTGYSKNPNGRINFGYLPLRYDIDAAVVNATSFSVDNIQFKNSGLAYTGSYSKTGAELYVDTNEETEAVIMASYDAGDILKDVKFVNLTGGSDNLAEISGLTEGTAATKLYIWNSLVGGKPILADPVVIQ